MANAFTFALRRPSVEHYLLAQAAVNRVAKNQPANIAAMVRAIFAAHGLLPIRNGLYCAREHRVCVELLRPRRWHLEVLAVHAVAEQRHHQATLHQRQPVRIQSLLRAGARRRRRMGSGHCEAPVFIGQPCATNSQCATRYCDRGDGTSHTGLSEGRRHGHRA